MLLRGRPRTHAHRPRGAAGRGGRCQRGGSSKGELSGHRRAGWRGRPRSRFFLQDSRAPSGAGEALDLHVSRVQLMQGPRGQVGREREDIRTREMFCTRQGSVVTLWLPGRRGLLHPGPGQAFMRAFIHSFILPTVCEPSRGVNPSLAWVVGLLA